MKNQYFGDINDYLKYGLIRAILRACEFRLLVVWMLTLDDGSNDGKFIDYLDNPRKWKGYDSELYEGLKSRESRQVSLIEQKNLLPGARYYSSLVPDSQYLRKLWTQELLSITGDSNLVFLDPDNGLEVRSKPYGRKNSSKYLYWCELRELWEQGKSLLIYQHFCREKRDLFIQRIRIEIQERACGSLVEAFTTTNVVFFLVLQPEHKKYRQLIVDNVQSSWSGQISHW